MKRTNLKLIFVSTKTVFVSTDIAEEKLFDSAECVLIITVQSLSGSGDCGLQ